ncbi:Cys-Gly metallodipeptidase [Acrasis kona]|uniref:Cys-Gly metallodipeptidase n=1 Tax=Acrasis kona TaxID=1008807 RepID=A0AAW2Z776_9EUKA
MATKVDQKRVEELVNNEFEKTIIKCLEDYIRIENLSPSYDSQYAENGKQEEAVDLLVRWVNDQNVPGLKLETLCAPGKTPVIFIEFDATKEGAPTVLLYGHMDKQPPFTGWDEGLGPYKPVIRKGEDGDSYLYGRGGADDGYAIFAAVTAVKALKDQNIPHGRIVILIEGSEESGSPDLPYYIEKLSDRIGTPSLVVCLDSGAGNYKQLWITTSLRGVIVGDIDVSLITEGVHSGSASGVVADSFRVARQLLSRIEDEKTGEILIKDLHVEIPPQRLEQVKVTAEVLGAEFVASYPLNKNTLPVESNLPELMLNRTWRPTLTVVGASGLPDAKIAGNVLRPNTKLRLSFRLPPSLEVKKAEQAIKEALTKDIPYNAKVEVNLDHGGAGWDAPATVDWVEKAVQGASNRYYGKPAVYQGEGGSIPFMGMLGKKFPKAQFVITGVLGPKSNAHGPNECINLDYTKKLNCCIVDILADHAEN